MHIPFFNYSAMGIRIPAQVSKGNSPAGTSTQSSRPKNLQKLVLDVQDSDDSENYADEDNEIMDIAEEEEKGGGGGNEEEEEEESSQEDSNKEDKDEPPKVQKRKNVRAHHGPKSMIYSQNSDVLITLFFIQRRPSTQELMTRTRRKKRLSRKSHTHSAYFHLLNSLSHSRAVNQRHDLLS